MSRPAKTGRASVLLVANNFPPLRGGSASVYANLARCAEGRIMVIASSTDYTNGLPVIGWREHDRLAPYPVRRLDLLRTRAGLRRRGRMAHLPWVASDIIIRARLALLLLGAIVLRGARTVCVGELLASSWILSMLRLVPGVRTIAYVHGEEITTEDTYDPRHQRARHALLNSDGIVVVSEFTLAAVKRLIGPAYTGQLMLIQNGVDTRLFKPRPKSPDLLRFYDLEGQFVFVSVSRLLEKKGTDNAIRAFAKVRERAPDCRLVIVGTGPYRSRLQEIAAECGVTGSVIFTGSVAEDELVEHYQLGDVFILPNRELPDGDTEGFGLVFLEANGCGLPAIAGQDGGSTDAVQDGVNGLVVNGRDVDQIATAMLTLREDPVLLAKLRVLALDRAARSDWTARTDAFLDICRAP